MAPEGSARNLVRAFGLLDILADTPEGHTLAELAATAELPEATVHRLLSVLADLNVARLGDGGRWRIGRRCLELGTAYLDSVEIRSEARDLMRQLTDDTGETSALGVLDDDRIVYIEKVDSTHPVRLYSAIGRSNPAVTSAIGRAILAWSPTSVIDRVLAGGLPEHSVHVADTDQLRAELTKCRKRGYSIDDADNQAGIRGVGAAILDYSGRPVAGLSVAGPEQRVSRRRLTDLGEATATAATELSKRLGYSPTRHATTAGAYPE